MTGAEKSFPHTPEFQENMLALMLRDSGVASKATKYIPKERLYSEAHQYLFERIHSSVLSVGRSPTWLEIEDHLKTIERHRRKMLKNFCKRICELEPTDFEFTKASLTDYAKRCKFVDTFQEIQTLYNSGDRPRAFEAGLRQMTEVVSISFDEEEPIPIDDFEKVRLEYLAQDVKRVATGLEKLDKIINGGLAAGELGGVLAAAKVGKSMMLVNIGYYAIIKNKTVLHFVLEGLPSQTTRRYQSRFMKSEYRRFQSELSKDDSVAWKKIADKYSKLLHIEAMTKSWDYTPELVDARIDNFVRTTGKHPDLVIIDYGDLLNSTTHHREFRHSQKEVYQKLKTLAMRRRIAIWTATQANRQKEEDRRKNLTDSSISESIDKARIFDLLISLNRTEEERVAGLLRIYVALYRDGASAETIYAVTDYARSIAYSRVLGSFTATELRAMDK